MNERRREKREKGRAKERKKDILVLMSSKL
jgi:hypothetical protein